MENVNDAAKEASDQPNFVTEEKVNASDTDLQVSETATAQSKPSIDDELPPVTEEPKPNLFENESTFGNIGTKESNSDGTHRNNETSLTNNNEINCEANSAIVSDANKEISESNGENEQNSQEAEMIEAKANKSEMNDPMVVATVPNPDDQNETNELPTGDQKTVPSLASNLDVTTGITSFDSGKRDDHTLEEAAKHKTNPVDVDESNNKEQEREKSNTEESNLEERNLEELDSEEIKNEETKHQASDDDDEPTTDTQNNDSQKSGNNKQTMGTTHQSNRLLGESVIVVRGHGAGIVATVVGSQKSGLELEHPSMVGKLVPNACVRVFRDCNSLDIESSGNYPSHGDAVAALARSLVGHLVLITKDFGAGLAGTVQDSHDAGFVLLDNPSLDKRFVKAKYVRLMSDDKRRASNQSFQGGVTSASDLVGKSVKIKRGIGAGLVALVAGVNQSFIILDHPSMQDKFIHTSLVDMSDEQQDGEVAEDDDVDDTTDMVGKMVRISVGFGAGKEGRVFKTAGGGFVMVDHPSLTGRKVHVRNVQVVDELMEESGEADDNIEDEQPGVPKPRRRVHVSHGFLGRTVYVTGGTFKGKVGKVVKLGRNGYIMLDVPNMEDKDKFVHLKLVRVLEHMEDDNLETKEDEVYNDEDLDGGEPNSSLSQSLLGKTVYINGGSYKGTVGKVIETGNGGFLTLDNPSMEGKRVPVKFVKVLNEVADDTNNTIEEGQINNKTNHGYDDHVGQANGRPAHDQSDDDAENDYDEDINQATCRHGQNNDETDDDYDSDVDRANNRPTQDHDNDNDSDDDAGQVNGPAQDQSNDDSGSDNDAVAPMNQNRRRPRFSLARSYLDKMVCVVRGDCKGNMGRVVKLGKNGYLTLDHPTMAGKFVHVKSVKPMDESENEMEIDDSGGAGNDDFNGTDGENSSCRESEDNSISEGDDESDDESQERSSEESDGTNSTEAGEDSASEANEHHSSEESDYIRGGKTSSSHSQSLLGTSVYVVAGSCAGKSGKVIEVGYGAYLTLDNPSVRKKVHVRNVRVLEDGDVLQHADVIADEGNSKVVDKTTYKQTAEKKVRPKSGSRGACRRLLGKFVRVIGGTFAGRSGRVTDVASRSAFVSIDHPELKGKRVHVKYMREVDEMQVRYHSTDEDDDNDILDDRSPASASSSGGVIGKTVYVVAGSFSGKSGKVLKVGNDGYLSLDNPSMEGKRVQMKNVRVLNDGQEVSHEWGLGDDDDKSEAYSDVQRAPFASEEKEAENSQPPRISACRRLLGKFVYVTRGTFAGRAGKVVDIGHRSGFIYIDHPAMEGKKVHKRNVREVDATQCRLIQMSEGDNNDDDHHNFPDAATASSFLGKNVNILAGTFEGKSGKVVEVVKGVYLKLDNTATAGKRVHVRNVRFLDDLQMDETAMAGGDTNETLAIGSYQEDDSSRDDENDDCDDRRVSTRRGVSTSRSLFGKLVYIKAGYGAGIVGRVVGVNRGAHLIVDHPFMDGKQVHLKNVRALDDAPDDDDNNEPKNWNSIRSHQPPKPAISFSEPVTAGSVAHLVLLKLGRGPRFLKASIDDDGNPANGIGDDGPPQASTDMYYDVDTEVSLKRFAEQDASAMMGEAKRARANNSDTFVVAADLPHNKDGLGPVLTSETKTAAKLLSRRSRVEPRHSSQRILPRVVMDGDGSVLPRSLSHLSPDLKVDVFNLRTGKVLSGEDAVAVKDLPELLKFTEYEPIIPPPSTSSHIHDPHQRDGKSFVREGRSGPNIRICSTIRPQGRPSWISSRDQGVVMKQGQFCGCIGFVTHRYPGGRYQVEIIIDRARQRITASAEQFDLLPESREQSKKVSLDPLRENEEEKIATNMFTNALAHEFINLQRNDQLPKDPETLALQGSRSSIHLTSTFDYDKADQN